MKAKVNKQYSFDLEDSSWDIIEVKNGVFHIINNNQSYIADVVSANFKNKSFKIIINQSTCDVVLKDRFDQLLSDLGMDLGATKAENDIKAPMPGRIISLEIEAGSVVNEGDTLLVLEAMKMENIIKSSRGGVINSIEVESGQTVNKNEVLVRFK